MDETLGPTLTKIRTTRRPVGGGDPSIYELTGPPVDACRHPLIFPIPSSTLVILTLTVPSHSRRLKNSLFFPSWCVCLDYGKEVRTYSEECERESEVGVVV